MKHSLTIKILTGLLLSCLIIGLTGCGSKPPEAQKAQSQAPTDSMQKAYGSGGRPGASASQGR